MNTVYASDLDGTLLGTSKELSDFTVKTVNKLIERGMLFTVITARGLFTVGDLVERLNLNLPIAIMNGAAVYDLQKEDFVQTFPMASDHVHQVVDVCRANDVTPLVFLRRGNETHVYFDQEMNEVEKKLMIESPHAADFYHRVDRLEDLIGTGEALVIEAANQKDQIRNVFRTLRGDLPEVQAISYEDVYGSGYHHVEVFSAQTNKGVAAEYIKTFVGGKQLVTFGDNYSDMDMFRVSDYSYAMENGLSEAKKAASYVLGNCDEDAVALCLKEIYKKQ